MVAIVVAGVAVVGQGSCHRWSRRCRRAATVYGLAAVGLLSGRPPFLPVGIAGIAIVGARSRRGSHRLRRGWRPHDHWWRRWGPHDHWRRRWGPHDHWRRRWGRRGGRTPDMVMQAAPDLFACLPGRRCTDSTVGIRWRWGWGRGPWCRRWRGENGLWDKHRGWWSGYGHRGQCCGHWLGAQLWQEVQEEGHKEQQQDEGNDAHTYVRPEVACDRHHLEVPCTLADIGVTCLLLVISTSTHIRQHSCRVVARATSGSAASGAACVVNPT